MSRQDHSNNMGNMIVKLKRYYYHGGLWHT